MSCPLITKVKDDLISKGIYNEDTFEISNLERFDKINKSWSDIARKDYNVTNTDDMFNIVKQEVKMLSGHSYLRNNIKTVWKGFPNLDFFKEFQEKYDKIKSNKPKVNKVSIQQYIKPGVAELFEQNPELAKIGTPQQYSQYLDTIFPDSKVKDIVYHGTRGFDSSGKEKPKFDKFDKNFIGKGQGLRSDDMAKGFYFGSYKIADRVGTRIIPAILNIEKEDNTTVRRNTVDFDTKGDVFVVFEPEQIHLLGGKNDIEGFKNFLSQTTIEPIKAKDRKAFMNVSSNRVSKVSTIPGTLSDFKKAVGLTKKEINTANRGKINKEIERYNAINGTSYYVKYKQLGQSTLDTYEILNTSPLDRDFNVDKLANDLNLDKKCN